MQVRDAAIKGHLIFRSSLPPLRGVFLCPRPLADQTGPDPFHRFMLLPPLKPVASTAPGARERQSKRAALRLPQQI